MINVAVIGAGAISSFHIEGYLAFPDRCRIVSVVDIDRARAERQIAWKSEGGGCTLNHAVHHIDALQWMAGLPVEVQAMFGNVAHDNAEIEDLSLAIMRFESGALGQLTSSVVHHGQDQRLVIQTEKASIAMPWAVYASTQKSNGFPDRDEATERALTDFYERLPQVRYEGHTGQIDNLLAAAPYFHENKVSVADFAENEITTTAGQR